MEGKAEVKWRYSIDVFVFEPEENPLVEFAKKKLGVTIPPHMLKLFIRDYKAEFENQEFFRNVSECCFDSDLDSDDLISTAEISCGFIDSELVSRLSDGNNPYPPFYETRYMDVA